MLGYRVDLLVLKGRTEYVSTYYNGLLYGDDLRIVVRIRSLLLLKCQQAGV